MTKTQPVKKVSKKTKVVEEPVRRKRSATVKPKTLKEKRAEKEAVAASKTRVRKIIKEVETQGRAVMKSLSGKAKSGRVVVEEEPTRSKIHTSIADNLDDMLDGIEKDYSLSGTTMDSTIERLSTSSLVIDLILGKGIIPGWYTMFGPEQSCKSTAATTFMGAALNTDVPIISYWDFEGCHTVSTEITTNFGREKFADVLKRYGIAPIQTEEKKFFDVEGLEVETLGQMVKVDRLYYSGVRPITRMVTGGGENLEGYAHPVLCEDGDGNLVYRHLELLEVGDHVVVKA